MKALSLRQPWANAVLYLHKRIENRRWNTSFRGEFLIHAAKGMTKQEYEDAVEWCVDAMGAGLADSVNIAAVLERSKLLFGGIVGRATLVDVVPPRPEFVAAGVESWYPEHARGVWRWHMREQFGFVLEDIRETAFVPMRGALGFFDVPEDIVRKALAA